MAFSLKYYLAVIVSWGIFGVIPFVIATNLGVPFNIAFLIYWVFGLGFGIPLDRKIENSWRGTVLREKSTSNSV